jgi:hypothetical protein
MAMAPLPESTRAKLIVAQLAATIRGKSAPNPILAPSFAKDDSDDYNSLLRP